MASSSSDTPHIDPSEREATYHGVMKASAQVGVPFSLALAMFFTALLVHAGIFGSIALAVIVYVATVVIVKMFFSH